ncbi:MAG: calcium-binding protein [Cyanobacteriota bacterium]|nr:calcium-binding protein [Cyanobacteriota bacterium]
MNTLVGGNGNDSLTGGSNPNTIIGLGGNDSLSGGNSHDLIRGDSGNDLVAGQGGHDTLIGGSGDDRIVGHGGNDFLIGGSGRDDFFFNLGWSNSLLGVDTIVDFIPGVDDIVLNRMGSTLSSSNGEGFSINQEFGIVNNSSAASSSSAEIVYDRSTGDLYYNPNRGTSGFGSGGQIATLVGAPDINEFDFILARY